jgi:hypothetical protein
MANIMIEELIENTNSIELSEDELALQGGKRRQAPPVTPPFPPSDSFPIPEYIPGFYI